MARQKIFRPEQFVATEFHTAQQKAEWANRLASFLLDGCKPGQFTKLLYAQLSLTFGHIAHHNIHGFYDVWFASRSKQLAFLKHTLDRQPCGDPKFTFSDVEREFQTWLRSSGLLEQYQRGADNEQHYASVAVVARALLKVVKTPVPEQVAAKVKLAREQVEEGFGGKLDDATVRAIVEGLTREFCQTSIVFRVFARSDNVNSFGHHGIRFLAKDGEAWEASKWFGTGPLPANGQEITVPLVRGVPDFGSLGFEIPRRIGKAPEEIVNEIWGQ